MKKEKFAIERKDLTWGSTAYRRGGSASAHVGRAASLRGKSLYLEHKITKIRVEGVIPEGHYTKSEMKVLHERLFKNLLESLETKVAKELRIPGR